MRRALSGMMIATASIVASLPVRGQASAPIPPGPPALIVTGHGRVVVHPDHAILVVSVVTHAKAAADAGRENARLEAAVMDTLARLHLGAGVVSTTGYSVAPEMRQDKPDVAPKQIGYTATNGVRLDLTDLDRIGPAIDAALAAGATGIGGLRFQSSRQAELELAALDSATRNARARAGVMAAAAGGGLGKLLELSTQPVMPAYGTLELQQGFVQVPTRVDPADITIEATVYARWEFAPGIR